MPDRVRIYIPTETADDGDVVELFGPDENGEVDWSVPIPGGRQIVQRGPVGRGCNAPAGLGPAGMETRWVVVHSNRLVFGMKEFGVKRYDRYTGEASGDTPEVVTMLVNAAPLPSRELTAVHPPLSGGRLKFTFQPGTFT